MIGAGGGIGGAVARELAARDLPSVAVSRTGRTGPQGAQRRAADAASTPGAIEALAAAPRSSTTAPSPPTPAGPRDSPLTEAVMLGAREAGAKLVMADNLYVPAADGPMTEESPRNATGSKGCTRIAMEERLLEAHASGENRVAIGRAADYYGQGGRNSVLGDQVFGRLAQGKRPRRLGDLDQPHTVNYLGDVGRALVTLGLRRGRRRDLAPARRPAADRAALLRAGGRDGRRARAGPDLADDDPHRRPGFAPDPRAARDELPVQAGAVRQRREFETAFGPFEVTPHDAAVRVTAEWFRRRRLTASPSGRNHNHA